MKNNNKTIYVELARAPLSDFKDAVISTRSKGGYSIVQEVTNIDKDTGEKFKMFMQGSMLVKDLEGMYALRDALNISIKKIEATENPDDWETD